MHIVAFKYLAFFVLPVFTLLGIFFGEWWCWATPIYTFGFIPLVEFLAPASTDNATEEQEQFLLNSWIYDALLYAVVPVQYGVMVLFLWKIEGIWADWFQSIGLLFSMGILCGNLGINVAHELGHRLKPLETYMAKALLMTSLYMHFIIEHNYGHHKTVATKEDPASAWKGMYLYHFWVRSMVLSYRSAWEIQMRILERQNRSFFSVKNNMFWFTILQVAALVGVFLAFGWIPMLFFVGAAVIGMLLLETINYIEHYGLRRKVKANGNYERVMPVHSWNSNHLIGRMMLFELSRHSDHHYHANRKYQVLKHHENSPQMPTGYPGMMLLSLFPPLWFMVMNPRVKRLQDADLVAA